MDTLSGWAEALHAVYNKIGGCILLWFLFDFALLLSYILFFH